MPFEFDVLPAADPDLLAASLGWDVRTWSHALPFWLSQTALRPGARALEVGAGGSNAGLSLWLAAQGYEVTCTGLARPSDAMRQVHRRYGVADRITYAAADVLALRYAGEFDLVVFKSVLGRVGGQDRADLQVRAVEQLHRALRPGGELWFAENAAAGWPHRAARRRFGAGRWSWRYIELVELAGLLAPFEDAAWTTFGVASAFGRTEGQRRALARLDEALLVRLAPPSWRYVAAGFGRRAA